MPLILHNCCADRSESAPVVPIEPPLLNQGLRSAGSASTPNLRTTLNTSTPSQSAHLAADNPRYNADSATSTIRQPPVSSAKPRQEIRDRSSSYGVPSSKQNLAPANTLTNRETSQIKGQAGTYGSVKSNKEDGFKVSFILRGISICLDHSMFLGRACA